MLSCVGAMLLRKASIATSETLKKVKKAQTYRKRCCTEMSHVMKFRSSRAFIVFFYMLPWLEMSVMVTNDVNSGRVF